MRGKPKYLVRWKKYTAEEDTWERLENLGNAIDLMKKFKKKIREEEITIMLYNHNHVPLHHSKIKRKRKQKKRKIKSRK